MKHFPFVESDDYSTVLGAVLQYFQYCAEILHIFHRAFPVQTDYAINMVDKNYKDYNSRWNRHKADLAEYIAEDENEIVRLKEQAESDLNIDIHEKESIYKTIDKLLKQRYEKTQEVLNEILPEAFSVMKETAKRFFENDVVEIVYTGSYFQIVSTAPHVASAANSATASASSATDSETSAAAAADSEIESAASEALSASSANFVGNWSDQTGAHVIPTSVAHSGAYWMLTTDIADITISEPGVSSDWLLIPNSYEQRVTDLGSVSGSEVINVSGSEVFKLAIAGAVDISFSNFKSDVHKTVMLVITGAASNITWSSAIKWAEGDAPSLSSGRDRIVFASEDAGVTIDAALCGSDFA